VRTKDHRKEHRKEQGGAGRGREGQGGTGRGREGNNDEGVKERRIVRGLMLMSTRIENP
jgi:hypothetical protein